MKISVTVLTKNSEKTVARTLESLRDFEEVLLYDTGSVDHTLEIARSYPNVRSVEASFEGFGPCHNKASGLARFDWILSIDSDEWLTPELLEEIKALQLDPLCVYELRRKNFFRGRWIWSCGWYPDWQKKLYHRGSTCFSSAQVHETILSDQLQRVRLQGHLHHEPYRTLCDFLSKMDRYSTLFALQTQRRVSLSSAIGHALFAFLRSYLLKGGCLQGYEGWLISLYNGHTALYKYLKAYERQHAPRSGASESGFSPPRT